MNAQELTVALGGRWCGSYGTARCPAHDDREPSLSIRDGVDGEPVFNCFAGCDWRDIKDKVRARGILPERGGHRLAPRRRTPRPQPAPEPSPTQGHAIEIWRASKPAENTPVESYLHGCGTTIPNPPAIRYHSAVKHADTGLHLPCLIAAACDVDNQVTGIQRIYLTLDGRKASVNRPKMALGTLRGSAVRLAPAADRVWLTEGIEDALALIQMMDEPAWAVLGTSGFKNVVLPENIKQVILAPDGDDAGQGVIQEAATRLADQGREVRVAKLPAGKDWVDSLEDYEERAGILEFDMEMSHSESQAQARLEVLIDDG